MTPRRLHERPEVSDDPQLIPVGPDGCPIFVAAARVRSARPDDAQVRFVSGWGTSAHAARRNCLLEAAERYSGQFFGPEPLRRARLHDLRQAAIPPHAISLVCDRQYETRRSWNRRHPGLNELPVRWTDRCAIDWIAASPDLSTAPAWLPAGLCFLGHDRDRHAGLAPADSNGVAAGRTIEDAAVRAFLELVERDAVAIWWYNRIARPALDPAKLKEPTVIAYRDWTRARERHLNLHDLSHDLRIPVVAAVSHDRNGGSIALGFGAGASTAAAAKHAVGELAQFESNLSLIVRRAARAGVHGLAPEARALFHWASTARLHDHPYLGRQPTTSEPRNLTTLTLSDCHAISRNRGLEFLAIELTRPAIGVPVCRVVIPGLRPLWARFAAGRLFDVPVRMGWRNVACAFGDLNPIPLMF